MNALPSPSLLASYHSAASSSSSSAAGWNLNALAPTEAPREPLENHVTGDCLHLARVYLRNPLMDFGFPVLTQIDPVQTRRQLLKELRPLTLFKPESSFENFGSRSHWWIIAFAERAVRRFL